MINALANFDIRVSFLLLGNRIFLKRIIASNVNIYSLWTDKHRLC